MRWLYSALRQTLVEYWEDRCAASRQTPFLLTITSGAHAAAALRRLADHHATADQLLPVLVESLQGMPKRRVRQKRESIHRLLEELTDQLGFEAYALTSVFMALTVYVDDAPSRLLAQSGLDAEATGSVGRKQEQAADDGNGLEEEKHQHRPILCGAPPERVHPQGREQEYECEDQRRRMRLEPNTNHTRRAEEDDETDKPRQ